MKDVFVGAVVLSLGFVLGVVSAPYVKVLQAGAIAKIKELKPKTADIEAEVTKA